MINTRLEKDSLGKINVPKNAYYGSFTARALNNFQISGITANSSFQKSLGIIKLAAIQTNNSLGLIENKLAKPIEQAAQEFIDGKFSKEFILDIFQAGAGTSYNMNANEIIANRANELLKGKKGEYKYVHPNNHVNMAQSTNDVIPTATRIGALLMTEDLLETIKKLEKSLDKKSEEGKNIIKVGRTHLQDAVPITFGQEFDSYKEAIKKSREFIERESENLKILGIGGTAVGTGLNSHQKYKNLIVEKLSKLCKIEFKSGKNLTEMANNMNSFMNFSSSLKSLATNLLNITSDLKLMNMGPKAGINEIELPKVQAGSSIMPGKINPSIPESIEMICIHILGNDKTIELAAQRSQFELNVMCPIIMYNLFQSIEILNNGIKTLDNYCIKGLKFNKKECERTFNKSLCTATTLSPHIGYNLTAEIVEDAIKNDSSIKEEVLKRKLMKIKKLEEILSQTFKRTE